MFVPPWAGGHCDRLAWKVFCLGEGLRNMSPSLATTEIRCCEVGDGGGAVAVSYSCAELLHAWPGSSYFKKSSEAVLGAYGTEQNCSHHSFKIFQQVLPYCSSNGAICNLRRVHVPFIAFMPATASTANYDKNHLGCS